MIFKHLATLFSTCLYLKGIIITPTLNSRMAFCLDGTSRQSVFFTGAWTQAIICYLALLSTWAGSGLEVWQSSTMVYILKPRHYKKNPPDNTVSSLFIQFTYLSLSLSSDYLIEYSTFTSRLASRTIELINTKLKNCRFSIFENIKYMN